MQSVTEEPAARRVSVAACDVNVGGRREPPECAGSVQGKAQALFEPILHEASAASAAEDEPKIEFTRCALEYAHAQPAFPVADQEIRDIFAWSAAADPSDVAHAREGWIREIERLGRSFEDSGEAEEWRRQAPPQFEPIIREVNIPLLRALVARSEYSDTGVVHCFTEGAPIVGALPSTGNGIPVQGKCACPDVAALRTGAVVHNQKI